ncbi:MAG: DUF4159 domain-containing protein [Gemmatimonadota bacterium]|nr:DUF4159 domain-containing protein [Gemmatimonadota bacterium]
MKRTAICELRAAKARWTMVRRIGQAAVLSMFAVGMVADIADAQDFPRRRSRRAFGWGQDGDFIMPADFKGNTRYDGRFTFARIRYRGAGCFSPEGPGWSHDYPRAEMNLMQIMREVTVLKPFLDGGNIFSLDDPQLFKYPVAYLSEPGCWEPTDEEIKGLRAYLLKGGFLIFDDFGERDGNGDRSELLNTQYQMQRALPGAQLIRLDEKHPIFDSFFKIESLDIIDQTYRGTPEYYGIFEGNDPKKRMIALLNMNNDIGDYWQFSASGFLPIAITNEAYKLGVNYIVYALTH